MPNFTAGTTFGANDTVTNTKLNTLIADAVINPECALSVNSGTISTLSCTRGTIPTFNSTTGTITTFNSTTGVIPTLTAGTTTSTAANITNGTVQTLTASTATITGGTYSGAINSTTGTIATLNSTTGTIPTLTTGTTTSTAQIATSGTIATLNSTTGTIATLNSTTGTIGNLSTTLAGDFSISQGTGTLGTSGVTLGTYGGATSVPVLSIDAKGRITTASTSVLSTTFATGSAAAPSITATSDTNTGLFFPAADTLAVAIGGLEGMRIDSNGFVGIGTGSPSSKLHANSTSASVAAATLQVSATSSTSQSAVIVVKQDALSTTNQNFVLFQVGGGTNCGKINANGANTAAFGSTSDSRLKENITALPSQIDNVCALKPCEFDYKDGSGHQIGFIAQEMQEVYPDAVGIGDDGMLTITAWSRTEARLVKAIQELKAKNDSLEARLAALESK